MVCLGNMCMDTLHKEDNDDDDDDIIIIMKQRHGHIYRICNVL